MTAALYLDGYGHPSRQAFYGKIKGTMLVIVLIHSADDLSTNLAFPATISDAACVKIYKASSDTPPNTET